MARGTGCAPERHVSADPDEHGRDDTDQTTTDSPKVFLHASGAEGGRQDTLPTPSTRPEGRRLSRGGSVLVARATVVGAVEPIPDEERASALQEGWIAIPAADALTRLA